MTSLFTLLVLTAGTATASKPPAADHAAVLLSRFEPGAMPPATPVIHALDQLAARGTLEHLPLLASLASTEQEAIQSHAQHAISMISSRAQSAARARYVSPGHEAVTRWLSRNEPIGPEGERLGRNERHTVAYSAIVLGDTLASPFEDWVTAGAKLEVEGHQQAAIRVYVAAALYESETAYVHLADIGLDVERLMLGIFTAMPTDHSARPGLLRWLTRRGQLPTVRVLSERLGRCGEAETGTLTDTLRAMIASGHLTTPAVTAARSRISRENLATLPRRD